MGVMNEMERSVRARLPRLKEESARGVACWCPLCEKDIMAFALSALPPRYVRSRPSRPGWERSWGEDIDRALSQARLKVTRHPKHSRWAPESFAARVRLVNFSLEEGLDIVRGGSCANHGGCRCGGCEEDTLALALSRARPRYGVAQSGTGRLPHDAREELRRNISEGLDIASLHVAARPRHSPMPLRQAVDRCRKTIHRMVGRAIRPS